MQVRRKLYTDRWTKRERCSEYRFYPVSGKVGKSEFGCEFSKKKKHTFDSRVEVLGEIF